MGTIYRIFAQTQIEGAISLVGCDMEFEKGIPFAIHTYFETGGRSAKQRIALDPLKLQKLQGGKKLRTGFGEFDYYYQDLIIFPTPHHN